MMSATGSSRVTMPTDWPADHAAMLDIALDHRAAQRAGPVMLDLELRLGHLDPALVERLRDLALLGVTARRRHS